MLELIKKFTGLLYHCGKRQAVKFFLVGPRSVTAWMRAAHAQSRIASLFCTASQQAGQGQDHMLPSQMAERQPMREGPGLDVCNCVLFVGFDGEGGPRGRVE